MPIKKEKNNNKEFNLLTTVAKACYNLFLCDKIRCSFIDPL